MNQLKQITWCLSAHLLHITALLLTRYNPHQNTPYTIYHIHTLYCIHYIVYTIGYKVYGIVYGIGYIWTGNVSNHATPHLATSQYITILLIIPNWENTINYS